MSICFEGQETLPGAFWDGAETVRSLDCTGAGAESPGAPQANDLPSANIHLRLKKSCTALTPHAVLLTPNLCDTCSDKLPAIPAAFKREALKHFDKGINGGGGAHCVQDNI